MAVSVSAFGLPRCYWMPIARYLSRDPESKPETCDGSEISDGRGSLNGLLNPDISSDEVTTILKEAGLTDYRFTATRNWIIDNPNDPRARVTVWRHHQHNTDALRLTSATTIRQCATNSIVSATSTRFRHRDSIRQI